MGCEPTALHCLSFSLFSPKEGKEASVAGAQRVQGRPVREEVEAQQHQATQEDEELGSGATEGRGKLSSDGPFKDAVQTG